jgi:hypothetical protein
LRWIITTNHKDWYVVFGFCFSHVFCWRHYGIDYSC